MNEAVLTESERFSQIVSTLSIQQMPWWAKTWAQINQQIENQSLPHAFLIEVSEGFATDALLLNIAQRLHCEALIHQLPCGKCKSCLQIQQGHFPDLHVLQPPAGKEQIPIDDVRNLINVLNKSAHSGGYRIVWLKDAHCMNHASSNAFLKTLEEPGEKTLILLQTAFSSKLMATIRSRCQKVIHQPLAKNQLVQWVRDMLSEKFPHYEYEQLKIELAVEVADQLPLKALSLLSDNSLAIRNDFFSLLKNIEKRPKNVDAGHLIHQVLQLQDVVSIDRLVHWFGQYLVLGSKDQLKAHQARETSERIHLLQVFDSYHYLQHQWQATNKPDKSLLFREFLLNWIAILAKLSHS